MGEVVILDDDLEEGEIADDIVPEPSNYFKPKSRKLPRRYSLHDHKNTISKHKKNCKHAGHHHKKKSKTKVSPVAHKKHHKSCPHHSSDRHKFKNGQFTNYFSELGQRDNPSNLVSSLTMKSAFRNFSSPPRTVAKVLKHNNSVQPIKNTDSFSTKSEEEFKGNVENVSSTNTQDELFSQKLESELFSEEKLNSLSVKQSDNESIVKETKSEVNGDCSDDEDEEELRRIALSTCLKRPLAEEAHNEEESWSIPSKEIANISNPTLNNEIVNNIPSSFNTIDNYEVVDMEVDDNETPNSDAHDEELFVIDTTPVVSSDSLNPPRDGFDRSSGNKIPNTEAFDHLLEKTQYFSSNEDFEEELLRAEIIASMHSFQQNQQSSEKAVSPPKNHQAKIPSPLIKKRQPFKKIVKSLPLYPKRPLTNFATLSRKRGLNKTKLNYTKLANHKKVIISPQRKVNTGQERIVITLNNDSSTEESDQERNGSKDIQENVAVASIEALISDARQKSDIHKAVDNNNLNTVSCLSKAQQEEYNSLKKILAEKQILPAPPLTTKVAKIARSPDFSILAKKISVAKENLEKEMKLRNDAEKELLIKKQIYMTSKLKVQHLKEQLHAAELNRATNLELWKKSAAKLDILKKSVLKKEALVNLLEERLNSKSIPTENIILSPVSRSNTLVN